MIQPTVGRVVHYYTQGDDGPLAAIVTWVHTDRMVNLCVFDANGIPSGVTSVDLVQPEDPPLDGREFWAEWMPYQVKKDFGSESGEAAAGTEKV